MTTKLQTLMDIYGFSIQEIEEIVAAYADQYPAHGCGAQIPMGLYRAIVAWDRWDYDAGRKLQEMLDEYRAADCRPMAVP